MQNEFTNSSTLYDKLVDFVTQTRRLCNVILFVLLCDLKIIDFLKVFFSRIDYLCPTNQQPLWKDILLTPCATTGV